MTEDAGGGGKLDRLHGGRGAVGSTTPELEPVVGDACSGNATRLLRNVLGFDAFDWEDCDSYENIGGSFQPGS